MYGYGPNGYGYQPPTNDYMNRLQALQQPQMQPMQITRVSGENGAKAFQMPPNSSVLLLDETAPVVWLKTTDGAGFPTCTPYQIAPVQAKPEPDYNSLNERITRLEAMFNNDKPDDGNAKQKRGKPAE